MQSIPLYGAKASGRVALIDDADYDLVTRYRWHLVERMRPSGAMHGPYAQANMQRTDGGWTTKLMHTYITGWSHTDHTDGNGLNNQRSNLRPGPPSLNGANQRPRRHGTSKYKGVSWFTRVGKWVAEVRVNGQLRYLGAYTVEADAARAYNVAALEVFGEYARLNEIDD